jgi:Protease inhibitor Inh
MTRHLASLFLAVMIAGCAGGGLTPSATTATAELGMPGRWMLSAPNSPMCGLNFTGSGRSGKVSPEGGCPGNFYLSRKWTLESDTLVINDENDNTLARLPNAGGRFEGPSAAGLTVTLARPPAPVAQ